LPELCQAVLAAKDIGGLPIIAQMSFSEDGNTLSGQSAADVARVLADLGVDVIGANCSVGPAATLAVLREMIDSEDDSHLPSSNGRTGCDGRTNLDVPFLFSAQPNAGLPQRIDNRFFYVATPDYIAEYAVRFAEAGVRLIGGCCGTTP